MRHSTDLRFEGVLMRQAYDAGKSGDWANYLGKNHLGYGKLSIWASAKVRECYNEAEPEDKGGQSIPQDILRKRRDFLRLIIVPADEQGGVHLVVRVPSLSLFSA